MLWERHGWYHTRLYSIWTSMKTRCFNKNHNRYKYYGGRGIKICDEWFDFTPFRDWAVNNGYQEGLSLQIDRIDNDGDYTPINCRFVSRREQSRNRSNTKFITLNGITLCFEDWCSIFKISRQTVIERLKRGWNIERSLKEKCRKYTKK
jgi:hypothetical protein